MHPSDLADTSEDYSLSPHRRASRAAFGNESDFGTHGMINARTES